MSHTVALAYQRLSQIHYFTNDLTVGTSCALHALTVAEEMDDSPGLARSYADLCMVMSLLCRVSAADSYAKLAEQVARSVEHFPSLAYVLNVTNMHRLAHARWDEVGRLSEESVEVGKQLRCDRDYAESLTVVAMQHCFRGKLSEGLEEFDRLLIIGTRAHNQLHRAWAHCGRGEALVRLGRFSEAEAALTNACQLLEDSESHTEWIRATGLLSYCLWKNNRDKEAIAMALKVASLADSKMFTSSALEGISSAIEVVFKAANGQTDKHASDTLPRLVRSLGKYAKVFPIGSARHLKFQGQLLALRGKLRPALKKFHKAVIVSEKIGLPWEAALAHIEEARWQVGSARRSAAEKAVRILEQTELKPNLVFAKSML